MALTPLHTITSEVVSTNPYWQYKVDTYTLPNGSVGSYYYCSTFGSVLVIARDNNGNFYLTKQMRYLNQVSSIEFPGGGLPNDVKPNQQARLELLEEAGVIASTVELLGSFNPMKGCTNEICHVYIALELEHVEATPEDSEEFEIFTMTEDDIDAAVTSRLIWDGMTLAAWMLYKTSPYYATPPNF